jgi:hypothetical protein
MGVVGVMGVVECWESRSLYSFWNVGLRHVRLGLFGGFEYSVAGVSDRLVILLFKSVRAGRHFLLIRMCIAGAQAQIYCLVSGWFRRAF